MIDRLEGSVRIAGGQGFYGDTPAAIPDLLTERPDYICLEALPDTFPAADGLEFANACWSLHDPADTDLLAAGTVVGHLLECSGQVTGGNHAGEWWTVVSVLRRADQALYHAKLDGRNQVAAASPSGTMLKDPLGML